MGLLPLLDIGGQGLVGPTILPLFRRGFYSQEGHYLARPVGNKFSYIRSGGRSAAAPISQLTSSEGSREGDPPVSGTNEAGRSPAESGRCVLAPTRLPSLVVHVPLSKRLVHSVARAWADKWADKNAPRPAHPDDPGVGHCVFVPRIFHCLARDPEDASVHGNRRASCTNPPGPPPRVKAEPFLKSSSSTSLLS